MSKKFLRRLAKRHSKLGKGRKKKQKWRKPKGRDNKMREEKKGKPAVVKVGYRTPKKDRGKINGKEVKRVENIKQAEELEKGVAIIASIGSKKRKKIEEILKKKKIEILNK
jgi:large subunit ribosomal protein L32e